MRYLSLLLTTALLLAGAANAVETTVEYSMPEEYCDGRPIDQADIATMEIYVAAGPIPASDVPCPATGGEVDAVPDSFSTRIEAEPSSTAAVVDLFPGDYFVRARVQDVEGNWSNLSNQLEVTVEAGPMRAPVLIRMTF